MSTAPKVGPLTQAELQGIWESTVDESFWGTMERAGSGNGFEAYQQAWAQAERVSEAVDTTTQAMFILPWSGQSSPPAGGPANATVSLTLSRTKMLDQPLILSAGTLVGETIVDWGEQGGVQVETGRRYALDHDVVFPPGVQGPIVVGATAERPGYGYNNPQPGTITTVRQPGTRFDNIDATVRGVAYPLAFAGTPSFPPESLVQVVYVDAIDEADAFLPDHVGQYVAFTAGANAGKIARVVGWQPPNLSASPPTGGTLQIERTESAVVFAGGFAGTFRVGEFIGFLDSGAGLYRGTGYVQDATVIGGNLYLTFSKRYGTALAGVGLLGLAPAAAANAIDSVSVSYEFVPEVATASWRILDWVSDWGLSVTNVAQPTGGRAAMLDALGRERNIFRSPGEDDDHFRQRIAEIADVVTPNAIRRVLNRTIPQLSWCFREAGGAGWPGFFFDHDAYDYDRIAPVGPIVGGPFFYGEKVSQTTPAGIATGRVVLATVPPLTPLPAPPAGTNFVGFVGIRGEFVVGLPIVGEKSGASLTPASFVAGFGLRPEDRFRVVFDYLRMRAWFYVGVPNLDGGDYGFAYDTHPRGAYDGVGFDDFYDGFPVGAALTYLQVQQAVDKVRAGGVGFDVIQNDGPCP